jgi:hypothetical protein
MRRGAVSSGVAGQVQSNVSGEKRAAYFSTPATVGGQHDPLLSINADDKV